MLQRIKNFLFGTITGRIAIVNISSSNNGVSMSHSRMMMITDNKSRKRDLYDWALKELNAIEKEYKTNAVINFFNLI